MNAKVAAPLSVADLPLVLALSREKTLAGAAERLGIDLSTVFRRLNALEQRLRVRLFDRHARGYQLTTAGERAASAAERVETELLALDREITGRDQQLSGVVRVTASETFSHAVLPPLFAQFHALHPRIRVVLSIDNRVMDLSRREADVALRVRRPTDPDLFGRKLTDVAWAFFGARAASATLRKDPRRENGAFNFGKHTVIGKDRAGFVVNALLIPYLLAAIRMVETGFATAEDVDVAMVAGCAHPMGPLALTDLIGLDTTAAVANSMYAEFKEPLYAPPPLLLRMVEGGRLGRKTGQGFYTY
jgi:DNA-binding transcriptional LysR family regulator